MRRSLTSFSKPMRVLCCVLAAVVDELKTRLLRSYTVSAAIMITAKIAVVTRISASVKPRWLFVLLRRTGMAGLLLTVDFGRVEVRGARPLSLVPLHDHADAREARGRPRRVDVGGTAGTEHQADPAVGQARRGHQRAPARQVALR